MLNFIKKKIIFAFISKSNLNCSKFYEVFDDEDFELTLNIIKSESVHPLPKTMQQIL